MRRDTRAKQEELKQQISAAMKQRAELEYALEKNQKQLDELRATDSLYDTLATTLEHIDKLDSLGAAGIIWGDNNKEQVAQNKQRIASALHDHNQQLDSKHKQRTVLSQEHARLEASIDALLAQYKNLQDEIFEEQAEFIIEREIIHIPIRSTILPWSSQHKDVVRLRAIMLVSLSIAMVIGYLIPQWELPPPKRIEFIEIPERLASLVVDKAPPIPVEEPKPQEDIEKEDEPEDKPEEDKKVQDARKVAEKTGLLAYKQDFADIIDASSDIKLGAQAAIRKNIPGLSSSRDTRSLITSQVQISGSGTNTSSVQRTAVSTDNSLNKVAFSHVESPISTDGDQPKTRLDNTKPERSDEDIQIVFDRYKDALYRIYNRELRKNPLLKGKLLLRLTIEPSGAVSKCIIDSSELGAPELEKEIIARVLRFNFGKKQGTSSLTILYPINFLPAS